MEKTLIELKNYHQPIIVQGSCMMIGDHLGGFDKQLFSPVLTQAINIAKKQKDITQINVAYVFDEKITSLHPTINFCYNQNLVGGKGWEELDSYQVHPVINFENFLCSFNGTQHVSRKLLASAIERFGWFNTTTCSKNFSYTIDTLDGHLLDFLDQDQDQHRIYRKFFIGKNSQDFFQSKHSFGHIRFDHKNNIYNLENKITKSFLHIVSETLATSYYPFVTEKFLYSIVTRGLFLCYAQPGWHAHLEKNYGFKKYNKIFDYRFDSIQNPVKRLIEIMIMISKFSMLSSDDWRDLYEIEIDTIEYNYEHYFSKDYLKHLEKFC